MSVKALIDGWNSREGGNVAAAFTPDGVRIEFAKPGARLEGREAIAAQAGAYMTAVPDCVLDISRPGGARRHGGPRMDLPRPPHRRHSRPRGERTRDLTARRQRLRRPRQPHRRGARLLGRCALFGLME